MSGIRNSEKVLNEVKELLKKAKYVDIKETLFSVAHQFRGYVVTNKLSGQVLNRVTGALVDNIQIREEGSQPDRLRYVVNPSMPYSAIHEFGGKIRQKITSKRTGKTYNRTINIPDRSYIRSSANEFDFNTAAAVALRERVIS